MIKVLFAGPTQGNGGILSWAKKFVNTFPDSEFEIIQASISYRRANSTSMALIPRIVDGLLDLRYAIKNVKKAIKENGDIKICHVASSGNIGSYRDILIARYCIKHGVKTVLHCHYGCVPEDYSGNGFVSRLLHRSFKLYDQIWVLDTRTQNYLETVDTIKNKVCLTPNSIEIKEDLDNTPKDYKRLAFIGNLIPTKGIFELTKAALQCDVRLDIIGPGPDDVVQQLKEIVGESLDKKVFIHGRLPNDETIKFIHAVDIILLPTYYPQEAFPISILEAMSLTKMVISCPRAAIPDMLTDLDGNKCGILVREKSVDEIVEAVKWCQENKTKADEKCRKAYEKVFESYRMEVVYEKIYRTNYRKLL